MLAMFGYGQGLVMAPLSSAVLSTVKPASAGAGSGMYGTPRRSPTQPASPRSARSIFAIEAAQSARAGVVRGIGVVRAVDCHLQSHF